MKMPPDFALNQTSQPFQSWLTDHFPLPFILATLDPGSTSARQTLYELWQAWKSGYLYSFSPERPEVLANVSGMFLQRTTPVSDGCRYHTSPDPKPWGCVGCINCGWSHVAPTLLEAEHWEKAHKQYEPTHQVYRVPQPAPETPTIEPMYRLDCSVCSFKAHLSNMDHALEDAADHMKRHRYHQVFISGERAVKI